MKIFKFLKKDFFSGLLVILPIVLTVAILTFLFTKINRGILVPAVKLLPADYLNNPHLVYLAKVAAFLILIIATVAIGMAARIIFVRKFFRFWEGILFRIPMVSKIYLAVKQLSFAFLDRRKNIFQRVVLIEYPRKGLFSLGFVTSTAQGEISEKTGRKSLNLFIPTTPNPTSGIYLIVPEKYTIPLDISVADGLKMVISGGAVFSQFPEDGR
jgi:uncharacterized membrane protein